LLGSVSVLVQPEAHMRCGEGHSTPHAPPWQVCPEAQRLSHRPQWALSVCGSMQMSPHISLGALQDARAMHAPATQA